MKSVSIMQPYLFPYIGYFQLMQEADQFIIYDDVDFINRGWINRNNILVNGRAHLFSVPLVKASQNRQIRDIEVLEEDKWKHKLLKTISLAYAKAPMFGPVSSLIEEVIFGQHASIGHLATDSIRQVIRYLGLDVELTPSSTIYQNGDLKAGDRLIDICHKEGATRYVNPIGGTKLYDKPTFAASGIELQFLKSVPLPYPQGKNEFVPYLSILDTLMFNDPAFIRESLMPSYELV